MRFLEKVFVYMHIIIMVTHLPSGTSDLILQKYVCHFLRDRELSHAPLTKMDIPTFAIQRQYSSRRSWSCSVKSPVLLLLSWNNYAPPTGSKLNHFRASGGEPIYPLGPNLACMSLGVDPTFLFLWLWMEGSLTRNFRRRIWFPPCTWALSDAEGRVTRQRAMKGHCFWVRECVCVRNG